MDNVKDDRYYLNKIIDDLQFLISHTNGKSYNDVESDPVLIDCIMFRLIQIAENSDKLTSAFKTKYKNLPWREIKGMRNRIVHDFVTCSCGACSVDGGHEYLRRCGHMEDIIELSITECDEEEQK